ncbi:MAG: N-ethylmaleimide reductase [Planctomycetota bacterium]|jgi:N-ethylmaleimide reductase
MSQFESLLSPVDLRDLAVKNRVALAPMTRARAGKSRLANGSMAEYYAQRAGVGLVITEATTVSAQANGWVESPGIYTDEMGASWQPVVEAVHSAKGGGAPIFLQLWHCGRASHSAFHGGEPAVSASAIKLNGEYVHTPEGKKDYETPRALETEELAGVVADYVAAARRAEDAGFDGVEVHAANGYLLDQFLQSKTNHRTDDYGGTVENRFRLLREVVQGIAEVFPASRIGVRLSPNGVFNDMGSPDYRETFLHAAKELDTLGLAYLHLMDGLAFGFHELGEPMTLADFREVFRGPLIGNCGYDGDTANAAIESGAADMIAIGRPMIANPDYVERLRNGWSLAPLADMSSWYSGGQAGKGYTDFPAYQAETSAAKQ